MALLLPLFFSSCVPCRHMVFVARKLLQLDRLSSQSIHSRWRMDEGVLLVSSMQEAINEMASLRLGAAFSVDGPCNID